VNDKKFIRFCFLGVVLGIILIYIVSLNLNVLHVKISEISDDNIGDIVNVSGKISKVTSSKGHTFFDLNDGSGKIKIVLWNDTLEYLEYKNINTEIIKEGSEIHMLANVEVFRGELELIPLREYIQFT